MTSENGGQTDGRTLRFQHRRPEILGALTEYILEHGVGDLSLRPAADAIGVTHTTLLRHFGSKEGLLLEVLEEIRVDFIARIAPESSRVEVTDLGTLLRKQWRALTTDRELRQFRLLFELTAQTRASRPNDGRRRVHDAVSRDFTAAVRNLLTDHLAISAARAETLAILVVAQYRGLVVDLLLTGDRRRTDVAIDEFIDMLVRASRESSAL
ncbi:MULTISPECIES: TetR/AcrR family transcriptional regulator [unclassified Brevibacterium]|uniref:TetR/AcrR family transcriptional regulator n=1 Tax=unclassified Brevibacterium TaxID=2614124 RepID=UPI001092886D|nr:TetR/AcrR family transcriptional regulator [Brevibacterium sp. S22]TGD32257.1 TetR/AcrR family transcriptional regulator [Brevibacterium sp. S22]